MPLLRSCLTVFPVLVCLALPARAMEATPEGATRLTGVFQTYLGTTPGVVAVTPSGAVYEVRLDAAPLLAALAEGAGVAGVEAAVTPWTMRLTDFGDGTWGVTEDQALDMVLRVPGALDIHLQVGSYRSVGVFDESLGTFAAWAVDLGDVTLEQVTVTPGLGEARSAFAMGSGRIESTGSPGATGGADLAQTISARMLSEVSSQSLMKGSPPFEMTLSADSYESSGRVEGLRVHPPLGLAAFFVAHPSAEGITAAQEDLRGQLRAALPLFDRLQDAGAYRNVLAQTPLGTFGVAAIGTGIDLSGLRADGQASLALRMEGLALPPDLVPGWVVPLVPEALGLEMRVAGFDLGTPAGAAVSAFDLSTAEVLPEALLFGLPDLLLPRGVVEITLAPGQTVAPAYALSYEGSPSAGPAMAEPTGRARVSLSGYDAIEAVIAAAPPEVAQQVGQTLVMARALAAREDDRLVWDIDATVPGRLLVNGNDLAPMLGQPE